MSLHIDNSAYARSNILFGRVIPTLVTIWAIWSLASPLLNGGSSGSIFPALLWVAYMVVIYVRRGLHPAVKSIEFLPDRIEVHGFGGVSSHEIGQVRDIEYEGNRNPARIKVLNAPFPKTGERILVVSLADGTELRMRVRHEHDAPLKEIASQI